MKDKDWRPKNWHKYSNEQPPSGSPNAESFEAGADAMLEALFKLAKESPTGKFEIDSHGVNVFHNEQ